VGLSIFHAFAFLVSQAGTNAKHGEFREVRRCDGLAAVDS